MEIINTSDCLQGPSVVFPSQSSMFLIQWNNPVNICYDAANTSISYNNYSGIYLDQIRSCSGCSLIVSNQIMLLLEIFSQLYLCPLLFDCILYYINTYQILNIPQDKQCQANLTLQYVHMQHEKGLGYIWNTNSEDKSQCYL